MHVPFYYEQNQGENRCSTLSLQDLAEVKAPSCGDEPVVSASC